MKGTFHLTRVFGIDIDIHVTFFLLLGVFFLIMGAKGLALILGVFLFVTLHELCHSLAAAYYGIKVQRIILLPIGGVAAMPESPARPHQELVISVAGPLSNIAVILVFYYPLMALLGRDTLMYPLMVMTGRAEYSGSFNILAHIYWINLVLAVFNMIPAFPMDGGRALRALLSYRMGYKRATGVAVRLGHIFALFFAYLGIVNGHIFLLIIAVFIYMAASSEGLQVMMRETIKNYRVRDILPEEVVYVRGDMPLSRILELMFHSHQEDYPVVDGNRLQGVITRKEIIAGIHSAGKEALVEDVMREDIPPVTIDERLDIVQRKMSKYGVTAMPVVNGNDVAGVVTMEDINRIYVMLSEGR